MVSFTLKCFDEFRVSEKTTDLAKLKEFRKTFFFFIMFTACLKFSSKEITQPVLLVFVFFLLLFFFVVFCLLFCFCFFHFWHNTIFLQNFAWPLFQNYCSFKISQNLFFTNVVRTCKITKINLMMNQYPKAVTCYFANFNF